MNEGVVFKWSVYSIVIALLFKEVRALCWKLEKSIRNKAKTELMFFFFSTENLDSPLKIALIPELFSMENLNFGFRQ